MGVFGERHEEIEGEITFAFAFASAFAFALVFVFVFVFVLMLIEIEYEVFPSLLVFINSRLSSYRLICVVKSCLWRTKKIVLPMFRTATVMSDT